MKKTFVILILNLVIINIINGQDLYKFRLLLTDKAGSSYSIDNPEKYLSQRAIERRTKYDIPIDISDLPVSDAYLAEIRNQGVEIVSKSKWINAVVVMCTDSMAGINLKNLPFVDSVKVVWKKLGGGVKASVDSYAIKGEKSESALNFCNDENYYGAASTQIKMHNGDLLHDVGYKGSGMLVAVLDAGFNSANTIVGLKEQIAGSKDFVIPGGDVFDLGISDHGLKVFSTMGANIPNKMVGTAPEAKYWLLRSEDTTTEFPVEEDYWAAAAEFADSIGVDVINSSLGYYNFNYPTTSYTKDQLDGKTAFISQAASMAARKGILVCNSAGNSGNDAWGLINFPGDSEEVFTTGSVNKDSIIAASSSRGPTADGRIKPDVIAMGVSTCLLDIYGNTTQGNGTSYASPIMAGLSASLWQALPSLNNMEIKNLIKMYGSKSTNPDNTYGYGIPNIYNAFINGGTYVRTTQYKKNQPLTFIDSNGILNIHNLPDTSEQYWIYVNSIFGELLYKQVINTSCDKIENFVFQHGLYLVSIQGKKDLYTYKLIR